ncbi:MCE family protein [Amycolatopsis sp. cg5]|uniref:MCE family protein n=1 Tax=Amycolatopsis sp. cg5 TaxID=3238802 RepID=UPI0035255117
MKALVLVLGAVAAVATSSCAAVEAPHITVKAQFRDAVGLYVGNDVAMLGIPIGKVTKIEPRGMSVQVELELDADAKVPAGAGAVTVSPSVVTDRHVELTPAYRGGPTLRDGDLIPLERTRTPVEIDRVLKAVDTLAGELTKTGVLKDATDVAADNLAGSGDKIRATVEALSGAVDTMTGKRDALTGLIKNVDTLTKAAADNQAVITSFTQNLTQASELFAKDAPSLGEALTRLNGLLDEAVSLIGENRDTAQNTLRSLKITTGTLSDHTRQLAESADVLPLLFQNLANAADPTTGQLRVHIDPAEMLLDGQLINILCGHVGVRLPGCGSGKLGDFGPDLGMTELLLGATRK